MIDIQELFNRIQQTKKKQKDIKTLYADALKNSAGYQDVLDKIKALREKKKQLEAGVKAEFVAEFSQLDAYQTDLASDTTLLSDAAVSLLMKGESIEVQDEFHNNYDPIVVVKFKKAK
jgi:predicted nuclease with TOPRIM domain